MGKILTLEPLGGGHGPVAPPGSATGQKLFVHPRVSLFNIVEHYFDFILKTDNLN